MQTLQTLLHSPAAGPTWRDLTGSLLPADASLVLAFGLRARIAEPTTLTALRERFPTAHLVLVSTAGNFADTQLADDAVVCTALRFAHARLLAAAATLEPDGNLTDLCQGLYSQLAAPDLRHTLLFSDGSRVNGTTLSTAFNAYLPPGVTLSGGLAGDGTDFSLTLVGLDSAPAPGGIVAIGLYGESLRIGFGSSGGWRSFGPQRMVTASQGNILQTLDDRPALALYREYLGEEASGLPASALRFPLHVQTPGDPNGVVRTILSIDEDHQTMTFAGDLPPGSMVRLMHASYDDLISGAETAASAAADSDAALVVCVSCVGRRIVLGQRTEEELESVRAAFGPSPVVTGFYSYGELAPTGHARSCQLHNQTMTITSIAEAV